MLKIQIKKNKWLFVFLLGALFTLLGIVGPKLIDQPLWDRVSVRFIEPGGDTLIGNYYQGVINKGVLLLEGFGSDQITMRNIASEYSSMGFHVFTFDFSGHGRSQGTLDYDNAETPRLAYQTIAAIKQFQELTGFDTQQIILVGHSLGARVALQTATIVPDLGGLILLGAQVNLSTNGQAEFFTGVKDADLGWVNKLGPENPKANILLISGEWDDILTPKAAGLLAQKLNGEPVESNTKVGEFESRNRLDLVILPRLLHNYEVYSPRVLKVSKEWLKQLYDDTIFLNETWISSGRITFWILGIVGFFLSLLGSASLLKEKSHMLRHSENGERETNIRITNFQRFIITKLLLWLGALPIGALLAGIFFFLPIGSPTFNLIYVAFFGGYGILIFGLYSFGRVPGTEGNLLFNSKPRWDFRGNIIALGMLALMLIATAAFTRNSWFYVFPLNTRLIWLVLFSLPTALGFWVGIYETKMIAISGSNNAYNQISVQLIGILPFFIYIIFLASIGSISGVVGSMQGLLMLGFSLLFGHLLRQVTKDNWVIAFAQAFLLYWLILPQGVLFS